jgi:hypothetical protein
MYSLHAAYFVSGCHLNPPENSHAPNCIVSHVVLSFELKQPKTLTETAENNVGALIWQYAKNLRIAQPDAACSCHEPFS